MNAHPILLRHRQRLAALLALALAIGLLALPTSSAEAATRSIATACPPGSVPDAGFTDIRGHRYEDEINCVAAYRIVRGTTATTYSPQGVVTRGQLATYVAGILIASGRDRPNNLPDRFRDDDGTVHEANINWIASLGIVRGYPDGTFRQGAVVTRAQAATYLNQAHQAVTGRRLTSGRDYWADDNGSTHEANINALTEAGILEGAGGSRFDPRGALIRAPMAAFVARTLDVLAASGHVIPPFGPKSLAVTPAGATTLQVSQTATSDRGVRAYEVAVPFSIKKVTIALFPAENVSMSGSEPRFTANEVVPANVGTSIESVNGQALTAAAVVRGVTQVRDVTPRGSKVTFTVDSASARNVVPVVYENSVRPSENQLDLTAGSGPRAAAEPVAIGGRVTWQVTEPATGTDLPAGTVRAIDRSARTYTLDLGGDTAPEMLVRWSTTDTFRYTATNVGPITRSQFEAWLSEGDRVDPSSYRPGTMTHTIAGDVPAAPTGVTASIVSGSVRVTFTKPTNPVASASSSSFRLHRAPVSGDTVGTFAEVASIAGNTTASFTDTPAQSGTYAYRIVSRSVTGDSPASAAAQVSYAADAPATTASGITDNGPTGTGGANAILDQGDRLTFTFDRPITVSSGWHVDVLDRDGTVGRLNASRATTAVSGTTGNVLTFTLTSTPVIVTPGAEAGVNIAASTTNPATTGFLQVIAAGGVDNPAGSWNLPKSGLAATYNNSRVVRDGTAGGVLTPAAPGGHLGGVVGTTTFDLGRDEVQSLAATGNTSGSFQLRFAGAPTAALDHDATAAQIQAALEGVAGIGVGNVTVAPAGAWTSLNVGPMTITFTGALAATDVPQLEVVNSDLSGGAAATVTTTLQGAAVTNVASGDTVSVFTTSGVLLGSATAGPNGRTTVTLSSVVTSAQVHHVVVTKPATQRRSVTVAVTS